MRTVETFEALLRPRGPEMLPLTQVTGLRTTRRYGPVSVRLAAAAEMAMLHEHAARSAGEVADEVALLLFGRQAIDTFAARCRTAC